MRKRSRFSRSIVALAGGVGAGKFLRGLMRVVDENRVTVVVNTADDLTLHGLHISPDIDSVIYWLSGVADRDRGWGREGETFRTLEELRARGGTAWFALGDLDLATHLFRTRLLEEGRTLTDATAALARAFGLRCRIMPMSDDPVTTRIDAVDDNGASLDLHFQEYWVARGGRDSVKGVRYDGIDSAGAAPGVLDAIAAADIVVICPSNPVVSIGPILAVTGIADALRAVRPRAVGVSPIVAGAPIRGMADRLMPAVGLEVSALGVARAYREFLGGWVVDDRDESLAVTIETDLGVNIAVCDTIMVDDTAAERVALAALELADR